MSEDEEKGGRGLGRTEAILKEHENGEHNVEGHGDGALQTGVEEGEERRGGEEEKAEDVVGAHANGDQEGEDPDVLAVEDEDVGHVPKWQDEDEKRKKMRERLGTRMRMRMKMEID